MKFRRLSHEITKNVKHSAGESTDFQYFFIVWIRGGIVLAL